MSGAFLAALWLNLAIGHFGWGQDPYYQQVARHNPLPAPSQPAGPSLGPARPLEALPAAQAWWEPGATQPLKLGERPLMLGVNDAVLATLQHSSQVRSMSDQALVKQLAVPEAQAKFDPRTFFDERFINTSDPVGNLLVTGGAARFIDTNVYGTGGIRRQTTSGAQLEASQRLAWQDTNSIYFVPSNQGTARMTIALTQPLMQGRGAAYQTSVIVIAEVDADIARDQLARDLQALLAEVHRNYWDLYIQRAALLQRIRLKESGLQILAGLEGRRDVDVLGSQLVRARAAVARRDAAITRYATTARNSASRLRALINDPAFSADSALELVTSEPPAANFSQANLQDALTTALEYRPEINQTLKEIRIAGVRKSVAENELMPVLNLVVGSYLAGLEGNSNVAGAFGDQFTSGRPTYWAGVQFDMPWGNRAAQARWQQRQVELRQITANLQTVTATVRSEVEIAVREIEALQKEWTSRSRAIAAAEAEIAYLLDRWRLLPAEGADAGVVLDDILTAQERLADAELAFVSVQAALQVAHIQLLKATGQLLLHQQVVETTVTVGGVPTQVFETRSSSPNAPPVPSVSLPPPSHSVLMPPAAAPKAPASVSATPQRAAPDPHFHSVLTPMPPKRLPPANLLDPPALPNVSLRRLPPVTP